MKIIRDILLTLLALGFVGLGLMIGVVLFLIL